MRKLLSFLALTLTSGFGCLFSQTVASTLNLNIALQSNSSITINGTTNVIPFKLSQTGDKLANKSFTITATQIQNKINLNQNQYAIVVRNFNSLNKMALRDFFKLMKADIYPEIKVQLNYIENQSVLNDYSKGQASVNITLTGVTKQYVIPISAKKTSDFYNLIGKMKLNIRDFGITPPSEMLGLIKVSEWIDIDLNFICKITPTALVRED